MHGMGKNGKRRKKNVGDGGKGGVAQLLARGVTRRTGCAISDDHKQGGDGCFLPEKSRNRGVAKRWAGKKKETVPCRLQMHRTRPGLTERPREFCVVEKGGEGRNATTEEKQTDQSESEKTTANSVGPRGVHPLRKVKNR